jgi:hypothetical protein
LKGTNGGEAIFCKNGIAAPFGLTTTPLTEGEQFDVLLNKIIIDSPPFSF